MQQDGSSSALLPRIKQLVWLLRPGVLDRASEADRSRERYRRIVLTAIASAGARGIAIATSLVSVPLTLHYLGGERYGVWLTISATIAMLGFADLGMGNGLLNIISESDGKRDRATAITAVSSAFFMLSGIAITLFVCLALSYRWIPWARVVNVTSPLAASEVGPAIIVLAACFAAELPLGVVEKVQRGYQEGFAGSLWLGLGNLLGLIGVLLVIVLQGGLPWLVLAMAGAPPFAAALNAIVLFGRHRPWLQPSRQHVSYDAMRKLLHVGFLFFVLQIAVSLAFASDNIVVAQVLGAEMVAQYAVPMRLFSLAPTLLGIILLPLWPAYREAIARGDRAWVQSTLIRSLTMTALLTGGVSLGLIIFGTQLLHFWVGPSVTPSLAFLVGLGVWTTLSSVGSAAAMFLNGLGVVRFQVICATALAFTAIVLKVVLAHSTGLPGIVWGTIIAYGITTVIPILCIAPKLLGGMYSATETQ